MNANKITDITVICNTCGSVLFEGEDLDSCEHINIEDVKEFYQYLEKKPVKTSCHSKPV